MTSVELSLIRKEGWPSVRDCMTRLGPEWKVRGKRRIRWRKAILVRKPKRLEKVKNPLKKALLRIHNIIIVKIPKTL